MRHFTLVGLALSIMVVSCAKPVSGRLKIETLPHSDIKSVVDFWIVKFGSPEFSKFSASTNTPLDAALLKKVTLAPEDNGVVAVRAFGLQKEKESRVATVVAQTMNAFWLARERDPIIQARAYLKKRIVDDPSNRELIEERLRDLDVSERQIGEAVHLIEQK